MMTLEEAIERYANLAVFSKMHESEKYTAEFKQLTAWLRELAERRKAQLSQEGTTSDTISRQQAIEALKEHRALYCDNTPDTFSKLPYGEKCRVDELDTAISTLVNLPSAQPAEKTGHWIPCSERLPEIGATVLFCDIDGDEYVGHWGVHHWWSVDDKVKSVVAWMPLPEPYEEAQND